MSIRGFISQSITEIIGFNWWYSHPPTKIAEKANNIHSKYKKHSFILHPIKCTTFGDLIEIMTAKVSCWQADKILNINELSEI